VKPIVEYTNAAVSKFPEILDSPIVKYIYENGKLPGKAEIKSIIDAAAKTGETKKSSLLESDRELVFNNKKTGIKDMLDNFNEVSRSVKSVMSSSPTAIIESSKSLSGHSRQVSGFSSRSLTSPSKSVNTTQKSITNSSRQIGSQSKASGTTGGKAITGVSKQAGSRSKAEGATGGKALTLPSKSSTKANDGIGKGLSTHVKDVVSKVDAVVMSLKEITNPSGGSGNIVMPSSSVLPSGYSGGAGGSTGPSGSGSTGKSSGSINPPKSGGSSGSGRYPSQAIGSGSSGKGGVPSLRRSSWNDIIPRDETVSSKKKKVDELARLSLKYIIPMNRLIRNTLGTFESTL
jgi:hypothetical protein